MGVYYGMNGLWVPVGGQGGTASVGPNLLAENIKSGVTISGVTGTFTNDGTATASDIASGATAYVNGAKITGKIPTYKSSGGNWSDTTFNELFVSWSGNWENQTDDIVTVIADANYDVLLRKDSGFHVNVPKSEFGDATAADVASGKTFTSSAGLKVTGTGAIETGPTIARATSRSIPNAYSITGTFDNSLPISSKNDIFGINIWTNDIVADGYYDHVIAARYDNLNISIACLNRDTYKSIMFANLIDVTISENSLTIDFSPILSQVLSTSSEYYMYIIY